MITFSLSPSGDIQAFCEPLHAAEPGYFLDLPEDGQDFKRVILQALLRRQGRHNISKPLQSVDVSAIVKWLEANPPVPRTKTGAPVKQAATLSDLEGLF